MSGFEYDSEEMARRGRLGAKAVHEGRTDEEERENTRPAREAFLARYGDDHEHFVEMGRRSVEARRRKKQARDAAAASEC